MEELTADRLCCDSGPHGEAPWLSQAELGLVFPPRVDEDGLGAVRRGHIPPAIAEGEAKGIFPLMV